MDNKNLNVNTLTCSLAPVALGYDVSEAAAPLKCLTGNFTYITSKLEANLGADPEYNVPAALSSVSANCYDIMDNSNKLLDNFVTNCCSVMILY